MPLDGRDENREPRENVQHVMPHRISGPQTLAYTLPTASYTLYPSWDPELT